MSDGKVSLCMIVRNEENRLARCLDSAMALKPEIVVVDTGSTDTTMDIACRYGAKVTAFDFTATDFAAARNLSIEQATRHWILVLDADETIDAASLASIQEIARSDENTGYYFKRSNRRAYSGKVTTDYPIRLFQNRPEHRYRYRVHEDIEGAILAGGGRLRRSSIHINHDFATNPEVRHRKNLWYVKILKEELLQVPGDCSRLSFLASEYHQLGMFDKATEIIERIVRLQPMSPEAHLNAGVCHLCHTGDRDRARADFMEALRLRPTYSDAAACLKILETEWAG